MNGFYLEVAAVVPVLSGASREEIEKLSSAMAKEIDKNRNNIKTLTGASMSFEKTGIDVIDGKLILTKSSVNGEQVSRDIIPSATPETAGVMSAEDKSILNSLAKVGNSYDLDTYTNEGVYLIRTRSYEAKNYPIRTPANSVLRLTVTNAYDGNTAVIVQVLNMNNQVGGEGGIYIRSCQGDNWKPWAKLQTNVEVGLIDQAKMDDLVDNGIYSGILSTTGETFVIICINNYAIAQQVGVQHISHLKYSLVVGTGEIKIEKRTRDAYGFWTEWSEIGSGSNYELPEATVDTLGGVKLGTVFNGQYMPVCNIDSNHGNGLGISIDSSYFTTSDGYILRIKHNHTLEQSYGGLSVKLGTKLGTADNPLGNPIIPCVFGTTSASDNSIWDVPAVGIFYNTEQFCLKNNGLNLKDGIGSDVTKVTWDANSNMNDFRTPGIYDIYGERTVDTDNLPISNTGGGHSIAARLTVVASTLQPANNEICITQFLQLSNRVGGDGATYVRTYNENNNGMNGWSPWQKQMGMVETQLNSLYYTGYPIGPSQGNPNNTRLNIVGKGLNGMIDNGTYSGIYTDGIDFGSAYQEFIFDKNIVTFLESFVLVVINDYAASGQAGLPRHITQLKYAVDAITGQSTVKKRVGTGNDTISWGDWEDISGGGSQEVDVTDILTAYDLSAVISRMDDNILYSAFIIGSENLPTLDTSNKIKTFLLSKHEGSALVFKFYLEKKTLSENIPVYDIKCYATDATSTWQYYHFVVSKDLSKVSVSESTTVL